MSKAFIETKAFDNISIFVIILNSIVMVVEGEGDSGNPSPAFKILEDSFLGLYTAEAIFKIFGKGFIIGEDAYLKDYWNLLDFGIVASSYATLLIPNEDEGSSSKGDEEDAGFSPASLRVFRVLRPLKAISSIRGLKVLIVALFSALPLLRDTLMILFFFFIIMAIAGLQLMGGELKNKCYNIQTGTIHPDEELLCGI